MNVNAFAVVAIALWAASGILLRARREPQPIGWIALLGSSLGAAALSTSLRPYALGVLPAVGLHLVVTVPDGTLGSRGRRILVAIGYMLGIGLGIATKDVADRIWPVLGGALAAGIAGAVASTTRYRKARGLVRQRMQWFGWAVTVAAGIAIIAVTLRVLVGWPQGFGAVAAVATGSIPIALVFAAGQRFATRIDRLLAHTVSLAGLAGVVMGTYVLVVVGLGRVPSHRERTIIGLSMGAAALAALLYLPARERLARLANNIVYGARSAPDEVLRTFGSRLSRSIPLSESLLQMVESLRKTLGLDSAEFWYAREGTFDLYVAEPDRTRPKFRVEAADQAVVARAGVSGPAWIKVWLPEIYRGREESMIRVAPAAHQGELLGLIVVERRDSNEPLGEEHEQMIAELARQVGLALHNDKLGSELERSLEELRKQAEDLRASRERVVVAADAARRGIERDIHDGAQQHLVALRVKLRLAQGIAEADPPALQKMLTELSDDVQNAVEELRRLSHGVYPKVLIDHGLMPALDGIAASATLRTTVTGNGDRRYPQEAEAAVYFICREAMQNATKHAGEAATATIRVWEESGALLFEFADTGAGFDARARGLGSGFTNMDDRLGAIGGTLTVESAPGSGCTIRGRIPL